MIKKTYAICFAIALCMAFVACKKTYNCTIKYECTTVRGTTVLVDYSPVPPTTVSTNFTGATYCLINYTTRDAYNAIINAEHQNWKAKAMVGLNTYQTVAVNFNDTIAYTTTDVKSKVKASDKSTYETIGYTCTSN